MAGKVRVYGKAQNRTVLGIVHAYMVMYPHATLEDLRKAFPDSLCPDSGVKDLFLQQAEAETFNSKMSLYFAKPDEVLELADGSKVALAQVWSKASFDRMAAKGKLYDIEVAAFEKTVKGEKGGYRLEYINGYVPPVAENKKKGLAWWIWVLLLLLVAAIAYLLLKPAPEPQVVEKEKIVEKEVIVRDTVYMQQIEEIETAFNAAQFELGKAELNDDAKLALHDLAKILKQNPELRLSITGHTSSEGDAATNLRLSDERAQAAVRFLVDKEDIDPTRLEAAGKGSTEPKVASDPTSEENRRTEFEILK